MIISVASGKGGTGKTTIAANLAFMCGEFTKAKGEEILFADCDVEEPDGHLFLKPKIEKEIKAEVIVPRIDPEKCTLCGKCGKACRFNALLVTKKNVLVFDELCHGCGTCSIVCEDDAIYEIKREIGVISEGKAGDISFVSGILNIGEAMATPLIRMVKDRINEKNGDGISIVDASPGTSCPVIEAVRGSDYVVLVTEPTPFGLSDLKLAVGMAKSLNLPMGVVINRIYGEGGELYDYLKGEKLEILAEIPLDRSIAKIISRGGLIVNEDDKMKKIFQDLLETIVSTAG